MPLFNFQLKPVAEIYPWGEGEDRYLNWFALSEGEFWIDVGNEVLFRYSDAICEHWKMSSVYPEHQIVEILSDMLDSAQCAMAPLPDFFESPARDWSELSDFKHDMAEHSRHYDAFRWLGERSPATLYFVAFPNIAFYRVDDSIIIGWDNRHKKVDGISVWTADIGSFIIPVDRFWEECHQFVSRLLSAMDDRLMKIETKSEIPLVPTRHDELLGQHAKWKEELSSRLVIREEPDVPWDEAEAAFRSLLAERKDQDPFFR